MNLGLIRCQLTEEDCAGKDCLEFISNQEGPFSKTNWEIKLIAITTCGGCPGNKIKPRIKTMVENEVEAVALASCIKLGTPISFPCPYYKKLKDNILKAEDNLYVFEKTHPKTFKEVLRDRIKNNKLKNFFKSGMKI